MKTYVKNLLSILFLISFLLLGLVVGNDTAVALNDWSPNGWVCPEDPEANQGVCDTNYNATTCTWGPNGCSNGAPPPDPGEHP